MSLITGIARPSALALLVALTVVSPLSAAEPTAPATTPASVSAKCPVVWRSTFGSDAGRTMTFSITDSATGRAHWLSVGEKAGDIAVTAYDASHEILSLRVRGKDYRIRLASAVYENEPEPVIKAKFAKDSQVEIRGLDRLSRLTPARRRIVMRWLADSVTAFDAEFKQDSVEFEKALAEQDSDDEFPLKRGSTADPATHKLMLSVEVIDGPGTTASVFLNNWQYTGGAHGNSKFKTMNFPGDADSPAGPAEMFANESGAYDRLSALSAKTLKDSGYEVDEMFRDGLSSKPENFTNIMLTTQGLRVRFEPYQVGPYADGAKVVDIPASELAGVMSEDTLRLWKNKYPAK